MTLRSVREHYARQSEITAGAVDEARRQWRRGPGAVAATVAVHQWAAARESVRAIPLMLDEQNTPIAPAGRTQWSRLGGVTSDGRDLVALMNRARTRDQLDRFVVTQVEDSGRAAAAVEIASRRGVFYERFVNPGACSRCIVQAGRQMSSLTPFQRHPNCRCQHVATAGRGATGASVGTNPQAYFESLSSEEQDRAFTKAGAEAIRKGADMSQVVNARSGMYSVADLQMVDVRTGRVEDIQATAAGTSRAGWFGGGRGASRPDRGMRLMPETILSLARGHNHAVQLLREYGYITR